MIKRALIFGLVGVSTALFFSGDTSASRYIRIGGITIETGSIISTVQIEKVQGLNENPFRVTQYTLLDVIVSCRNPQGMLQTGLAYSGPPKKIEGASTFTLDDDPFGDKSGNTATSVNQVEPADIFTAAEVCPNGNWTIEDLEVFSLSFVDTIKRCVKSKNNPCAAFQDIDILAGECTLNSGGTYDCIETSHIHSD